MLPPIRLHSAPGFPTIKEARLVVPIDNRAKTPPKKQINAVHFLNALADVTSHNDRGAIQRGLLETLREYHCANEYWLYQVLTVDPELTLGLLADTRDNSVTVSDGETQAPLLDTVTQGVINAVLSGVVVDVHTPSDDDFVIYPAYDTNSGDVFAVLIERACDRSEEAQRLVHGLLRIYSNYLRLLEQNRRDKLTGLLNRETLEEEITRIIMLNHERIPPESLHQPEVENDAREPEPGTQHWLAVLDIDHFKQVNDTFGHIYGDEILILVSRLILQCVRSYDRVFRFGGEEFVILIRGSDLEDARATFERMRTTVGHHGYAKVDQVTVSIGVAEIGFQTSHAEVIAQADEALYYAKNHGRDQTRFYDELVAAGEIPPPAEPVQVGGVSFF